MSRSPVCRSSKKCLRGLLGILGRAFSQLRVSVHQDLEVLLSDRQLNIEDCLVVLQTVMQCPLDAFESFWPLCAERRDTGDGLKIIKGGLIDRIVT